MSTKESVIKSVSTASTIKILPAQLARLKKEEEEETWISGEELYTEGSSDEESCRGKSTSSNNRTTADSLRTLSIAKVHRSKSKADKKKSLASSSLSSRTVLDQTTLSTESEGTSTKGRSSPMSSVSDDQDEEYPADDEISWKANREFILEDEIQALEEHQREYPKICDAVDQLFENYFEKLKNLEQVESEHFFRESEKLQEDIKSSLSFVDAVINELDERIQNVKKTTKKIQIENRLKLQKIIAQGPPESKKLSENTKKFFDLCPNT